MGNRPKMDRSERAKQFMPFDAVKGLREALRAKEIEVETNLEIERVNREKNLDTEMDGLYNNYRRKG